MCFIVLNVGFFFRWIFGSFFDVFMIFHFLTFFLRSVLILFLKRVCFLYCLFFGFFASKKKKQEK